MKTLYLTAISGAIGLVFTAGVMAQTMTKDAYKAGETRIAAEYASDKAKCDALSGNTKDICVAEAKAKEKIARADLEASYEPSAKHRYEALVAKAEGEYAVANEKCDAMTGNDKDVCVTEAKAAKTRMKADAEAQLKTWEAKQAATEKSATAERKAKEEGAAARQDAATEKRDADYAVAKEKCDALAGADKDRCEQAAKMKYAK
jgi:hypothetical protein